MKNRKGTIKGKSISKRCRVAALLLIMTVIFTIPAYADGDPIAVVNNFANYFFLLMRAAGAVFAGYGLLQVGMSLQSHDPSQRSQGFLCVVSGLIVIFAKEILTAIGAI